MESALPVLEEQPSASIQPHRDFSFPKSCHLLVTTTSHIYAWDHTSINSIFQSSKNGIVAAREAPNGSGVLVVADKHVVVLHDTKRGKEKSWGLRAEKDEVRQLEYTSDARSLYLSTSLTADIQRYSTELSRLLDPARTHASPPVALAISPTGRFMVSASDHPPVVYLKNLEHNTSPVPIEPRASRAAVAVAAFHPERPNVFLLAFRDGTAAAYDATKILRSGTAFVSDQESINQGEVCHLSSLHRAASNSGRSAAITDAAFLPGFKWRAVTVGNDGRCRIIDFADGGVTLRTWHAKAPVTSVSVFAEKPDADSRRLSRRSTPAHVIGGPTSTDSLIAIGRADGEVLIYNSVGLLLIQRSVGETRGRIISVEWIKGPSPRPVGSRVMTVPEINAPMALTGMDDYVNLTIESDTLQCAGTPTTSSKQTLRTTKAHSKRQRANTSASTRPKTLPKPPRKFTIHPDEVEDEDGTVRRTPLPQRERMRRMTTADFTNLFSPSKIDDAEADIDASSTRVVSPPRSRPAITSQTFVKSPEPGDPMQYDSMARRRNLALFPSTDSKPETPSPSQSTNDNKASPLSKSTKRATFSASAIHPAHPSADLHFPSTHVKLPSSCPVSALAPVNSTVQGFLSEPNLTRPSPNKPTFLISPRKSGKMRFLHRPKDHIETDADSETAREAYEHFHRRCNWPEDSNQDSSAGGDGYVSSRLRKKSPQVQTSPTRAVGRSLAEQTSRSQVVPKGTASTIGGHEQHIEPAVTSSQPFPKIDGSTEEDIFTTADTHVTSSGAFSPSSKDVCALFPRSSSLSPQKGGRSRSSFRRPPEKAAGGPSKAMTPRKVVEMPSKSPWARAKILREIENGTGKPNSVAQIQEEGPCDDVVKAMEARTILSTDTQCIDCRATHAKILLLEVEVARLREEISGVKAKLKRRAR